MPPAKRRGSDSTAVLTSPTHEFASAAALCDGAKSTAVVQIDQIADSVEGGEQAARRLSRASVMSDVIICGADVVAYGVLQGLDTIDLSVAARRETFQPELMVRASTSRGGRA